MTRRLPRTPIRERSARGLPRHTMRRGWPLTYPKRFPVTTRKLDPARQETPVTEALRPQDYNGFTPEEPPRLPSADGGEAHAGTVTTLPVPHSCELAQVPSGFYQRAG